MADEKYTFEQARIRLEEIATEVRKKDTSLEKSLDLLEEGVRLANICTELVDHTDVGASVAAASENDPAVAATDAPSSVTADDDPSAAAVEDAPSDDVASEAGDTDESADAAEDADADGFDDADDEVGEPSDSGIDD